MKALAATLALVAFAETTPALADPPRFGVFVEGGRGAQVAGGDGFSVVLPSRTFVRIGGMMSIGDGHDILSVAAVADVEPIVALGADAQWGHWVFSRLLFQAGPIAYFAPQTLLGVTGGARYRVPLGPTFSMLAGIQLSGFFAGSDLPDGTALLVGLLVIGLHANL